MKAILLVEDEPMIGVSVRDALQEAGYEVLGPCLQLREAHRVLDLFRPDAAILDIELLDGSVETIVQRLEAEAIPYCFMTGHKRTKGDASDVEWLEKPFHEWELLAVLDHLLKQRLPPETQASILLRGGRTERTDASFFRGLEPDGFSGARPGTKT